ncbi:MAG: hypothetical protein HOI53_04195 [Francisellaceae bacterium]|jgi:ankyrin repeat protein|nr:hypothetical protein [Francisellaceae bacterium]MBT6207205.1 hypothetical protein [Francisellaceae bacterium]MBT6538049.1 hypothetical protein [Francisellaceae bacterium]
MNQEEINNAATELDSALQRHDKIKVSEFLKNTEIHKEVFKAAAFLGHSNAVCFLLTVSSITPSTDDNYALSESVKEGHIEIVDLLLRDPRVVPVRNRKCVAAELAAAYGHKDILIRLLHEDSVEPSGGRNSIIRLASANGNEDIVEMMLEYPTVNPGDANNSALILAVKGRHLNVANILIRDDRVVPSARDNYPICKASFNGDIEMVELLLNCHSVNPAARNNLPFRIAAKNNHPKVLHLLSNDNRVNLFGNNNSLLRIAAKTGETGVIAFLLKISQATNTSWTLKSIIDTGKKLIWGSIDPTVNNNEPIISAVIYGHSEIVRILLNDDRVDLSLFVGENSLLVKAVYAGHLSVVKVLLESQKVNPSNDGNLALKVSAGAGQPEILNELMKSERVNVSAKDIKDAIDEVDMKIIYGWTKEIENVLKILLAHKMADFNWVVTCIGTGALTIPMSLVHEVKGNSSVYTTISQVVYGEKIKTLLLKEDGPLVQKYQINSQQRSCDLELSVIHEGEDEVEFVQTRARKGLLLKC